MEVGGVAEVVSVTGEAPVAEPGKIDLGRTIGEAEVKNLPLVSRNPYNFAFLQANVTGYENNEFGVAAHQRQRHADAHELPDRRQHQHARRTAPACACCPLSEIMVREVKVITSGLRARVRPDDGHGLQRRHPVGHQRRPRLGQLPLPPQGHVRAAVLPLPDRAQARHPRRQLHGHPGRADREGQVALLRRLRVRGPRPLRRPRHHSQAPSTTPRARALADGHPAGRASSRPRRTSTSSSARPTTSSPPSTSSPRATSSSRTTRPSTSAAAPTRSSGPPTSTTAWTPRPSSSSPRSGRTGSTSCASSSRARHQSRTASDGRRHRPRHRRERHRQLRRPARRRPRRRLRLQPEDLAGLDNFTVLRGQAQLQGRLRPPVRGRRPRNNLRPALHLPHRRRLPGGQERRRPRALLDFQQDSRRSRGRYNSSFHRPLRPGRLPRQPTASSCSSGCATTSSTIPDARPFAANPLSQRFKVDKNNFAPRAGLLLDASTRARGRCCAPPPGSCTSRRS